MHRGRTRTSGVPDPARRGDPDLRRPGQGAAGHQPGQRVGGQAMNPGLDAKVAIVTGDIGRASRCSSPSAALGSSSTAGTSGRRWASSTRSGNEVATATSRSAMSGPRPTWMPSRPPRRPPTAASTSSSPTPATTTRPAPPRCAAPLPASTSTGRPDSSVRCLPPSSSWLSRRSRPCDDASAAASSSRRPRAARTPTPRPDGDRLLLRRVDHCQQGAGPRADSGRLRHGRPRLPFLERRLRHRGAACPTSTAGSTRRSCSAARSGWPHSRTSERSSPSWSRTMQNT